MGKHYRHDTDNAFSATRYTHLYPPIQNFAVHRVADYLSENMGINFKVEKVRLAFPLDLSVHHVTATEQGDTLLDAQSMRLNVQLLPLFKGQANVDGVELYGLKLDTKSYISDTHIKGSADHFTAATHGVDWKRELVNVDRAQLRGANLLVELSDTAQKTPLKAKPSGTLPFTKLKSNKVKCASSYLAILCALLPTWDDYRYVEVVSTQDATIMLCNHSAFKIRAQITTFLTSNPQKASTPIT